MRLKVFTRDGFYIKRTNMDQMFQTQSNETFYVIGSILGRWLDKLVCSEWCGMSLWASLLFIFPNPSLTTFPSLSYQLHTIDSRLCLMISTLKKKSNVWQFFIKSGFKCHFLNLLTLFIGPGSYYIVISGKYFNKTSKVGLRSLF